jgi:hypothetical protein
MGTGARGIGGDAEGRGGVMLDVESLHPKLYIIYRPSNIAHQTLPIKHCPSNIAHQTSHIKHRTSSNSPSPSTRQYNHSDLPWLLLIS